MFQAKEALKYFRNLPNCNIRNKSEQLPSVKKIRYVLCQCRQDSNQLLIDIKEQISTQCKQEFSHT